jgi:protein tyrosine/serine phosphatase
MSYIINNVTENIYRSSRPEFLDLQFLKIYGIKNILSLEDDPCFRVWEKQSCRDLDLELTLIPMSGFRAPDPWLLKIVVRYLVILRKPLLVHCKHGRDRTGFVVAAYRMIFQGWSFEKAYQECLDNGHSRWMFWWKNSLRKIALDSCLRRNDE